MLNMLALAVIVATTGHYSVGKVGGMYSFLEPSGRRFWSLGVCCVNEGTAPESYDPKNPSYASFRLFETDRDWALDTLGNLRRWGFNTIGGWSNTRLMQEHARDRGLPYTMVLHLGAYYRAPWSDIFHSDFEKVCNKAAREQILPVVDDPLLIGYFSDNELGWWDDTLFLNYFAMPASSPGKKKLLSLFRRHYASDFSRFKKDWGSSAESFDQLARDGTTLYLRPGGDGIKLINKWTYALASRYYQTVRNAIRKYDKRRLILGDRYAQYWDFPVLRAAGKYVDVISTNYGAEFLDGTLSRYFLDTIYQVAKKPVLISEFYWNAMENRSGNKNSVKAFPIVSSQEERAKALAVNLDELWSRPYVVGAHWFQYYDEPTHGRADGEDNNMGLVDIEGRPYELVVRAFQSFSRKQETRKTKEADSCNVVPKAPTEALRNLTSWPRKAGWVKPATKEAFADLYICQDAKRLYIGIQLMDFIDPKLYRDGIVPESERPCLRIQIGNQEPLILRFSGYQKPTVVKGTNITLKEMPSLKHTILIGTTKPASFAKQPTFELKATLQKHSRASTMTWKAKLRLKP